MKVGHCQALYNRKGHSDRGGLFYYLSFRQGDLLERSDKNARTGNTLCDKNTGTGNAPSIASAYTPSLEISVFGRRQAPEG